MLAIRWALAVLAALLLAILFAAPTAPVMAGPDEVALLQSYVGSWAGKATITGDDGVTTPFTCRLFLRRGNAGKLVLSGTCPLVSAAGTIAYVDASRRYEMALTSSAEFRGAATGKAIRGQIVFSLSDHAIDSKGDALALDAQMAMAGDRIAITFEAVLNGGHYRGTLDFAR